MRTGLWHRPGWIVSVPGVCEDLPDQAIVGSIGAAAVIGRAFGTWLVMDYSITPKEFRQFRALIYQECGINLNEIKTTLLASRRSNGCASGNSSGSKPTTIWLQATGRAMNSRSSRTSSRRIQARS